MGGSGETQEAARQEFWLPTWLAKNPSVILALVLPLVAITASFFTFVYELGYCLFFAIPPDYILLTSIRSFLLGILISLALSFIIVTIIMPILIGTRNTEPIIFMIAILLYNIAVLIPANLIWYMIMGVYWSDLVLRNIVMFVWILFIAYLSRHAINRISSVSHTNVDPAYVST